MKKVILTLVLLISLVATSQTTINLSGMTADVSLGDNCSSSQNSLQYVTTGDLNLNGRTLNLRNVVLKVNGNINGGGRIIGCGQAALTLTGTFQNNPIIEVGLLGLPDFGLIKDIPKNLKYTIYDISGKTLKVGNTNNIEFPENEVIILKVEGYAVKKIYLL